MSKKKKIIIAIVCSVIIIAGIVTGIILATIKRFDISTSNGPEWRDYNKMYEITIDDDYYVNSNTFLDGGLVMITDTTKSDSNQGYYSFDSQEIVIPAEYNITNGTNNLSTIDIVSTESEDICTLYKSTKDTNQITIINHFGQDTRLTKYDTQNNQTYGYIKEKVINLKNSKDKVKAKVKNSFVTEEILLKDIQFNKCYYRAGRYNYEVWTLTDIEDNKYTNIYSVNSRGIRSLTQTLSSNIGIEPSTNLADTIFFLANNEIRFINTSIINLSDDINNLTFKYQILDINFKEKDSFSITLAKDRYSYTFAVGNSIFIQEKIPSSEKKYDFAVSNEDGITMYYQLKTHKINFKSGKLSEVDFDYVVTSHNSVTPKTSTITASKIKSKALQNETIYLINERLQCKEIGYQIDSLYRVSKSRYIVENAFGLTLVDKKYNMIASLGTASSYFTTNSSIIIYKDNSAYITTHDGVVIKKYNANQVHNILDNQYYLVEDNNNYYLENLGKRITAPSYALTDIPFYYNNRDYNFCRSGVYNGTIKTNIEIVYRISGNDGNYTYDFYNAQGKLLLSASQVTTSTKSLQLCYQDSSMIVVYFEDGNRGHYYKITA